MQDADNQPANLAAAAAYVSKPRARKCDCDDDQCGGDCAGSRPA